MLPSTWPHKQRESIRTGVITKCSKEHITYTMRAFFLARKTDVYYRYEGGAAVESGGMGGNESQSKKEM